MPWTTEQIREHRKFRVDASIDHIFPQCRYPELKYYLNNIEWVDFKINLMKRDLTKDEFIAICTHIVERKDR